MPARVFLNPHRTAVPDAIAPDREPLAFHARLPGYAPTPLVDAPSLAADLGIARLWVKDESHRLGLPAFKILGASWATYRALRERLDAPLAPWATAAELAERFAPLRPLTLATATDGNHGRAVAHVASLLGLGARIFVPAGAAQARLDGIASEGAEVVIVDGGYDEAVARAAAEAGPRCLVISDTSWPGYEDIPRWVAEGYSTLFWEIEDALATRGETGPDLVLIPVGVGALAVAAARHYRRSGTVPSPRLVSIEPDHAACALASAAAGHLVSLPGPCDSIMAGLNCETPSEAAWPEVSAAYDAFLAIEDERARESMRQLAAAGVTAGETGAAALGGLLALVRDPAAAAARAALEVGPTTRALVICTEGATDPAAYARIVGTAPRD